MAILKDLIVHGSSRFLNKIYASEIQTPLIDAEAGIFKKLKADDATVVGLLDVQGQMHTNTWSNSNIATIDGSFYIAPTLSSSSGTVSFSSATAATFTGTYSAVSSLYIGNNTASTVQWTSGSKILITGEVQVDEEWIPLGTLLGILNSTNPTTSMPIVNITDNRNNTSNILTNIYSLKDNASLNYRNLKISLYQRVDNSQYYPLGIYITALGQNGKTFLDIYGGVNELTTSYGGYANPNVRIGNLSGLPAITTAAGNFSPVGWGIYTTNGYFSGTIVSNTGVIGGWKLGASSLYNGTTGLNNNKEGIYLGIDGIRNYKDINTYVNIVQGVIKAKGVNLTGQITATSGTIGGASITNGTLIIGNANINDINASKINAGDIAAARIETNLISAINAKVSDLSALTATIGGFQIDSSSIHTNNIAVTSNADNSIALSSTDFTRTINSTSRTGLRFAIGDKFGVTGDGIVYASDVDLTGKITATSGTIGGIDIVDGALDVSSISIGSLGGASNYAQKTDVTQAIDNIEIGGRNLIRNTAIMPTTKINGYNFRSSGGTVTHVDLDNSPINGITGAIRITNKGSSTARIGMAQDSLKNCFITGEKYTMSCWVRASVALEAIFQIIWASDERTTKSSSAILGYNFNVGTDWTYLKWEGVTLLGTQVSQYSAGYVYGLNVPVNGWIEVCGLKVEKGNKVTDWTPAPEDVNADIEDARKVATNYITQIDNTGIKIAPYDKSGNDYLQLNSDAISMYRNNIETLRIEDSAIRIGKINGRNVFIGNDSVDIRDRQNTLASFTGDNTRFYDPIYNKELATFGVSGAIIGANSEQRFVIEKDGIKSINDSGATVFSVNSTEGTVVTEAEVAPSGETDVWSSTSIALDTVGSGFSVDVTFYNKSMTAIIVIYYCNSNLTNVKVNSVSSSAIKTSGFAIGFNASTYSIDLPPFTFTHGTAQTTTYTITASFVNIFGDSYDLTAVETVTYDGAITITLSSFNGKCVRTSGNNEKESMFAGLWSKVIYGEIYQSSAYTKAPAMTFGTRGKNAILAPFSVTIGEDLYANNDNQLSIGRYNLNNDEFAFAIGNGTSDTNRSNAFNVDWDGNTEVMGNLEVNNNQTVTNNLSVGGDETIIGGLTVNGIITDFSNSYSTIKYLNVEYLTVSTRKPFLTVRKTYTRTITANSACYISQNYTSPTGYIPVGIIDWGTYNGTHADYCVMGHAYIWRGNPNLIDIYVWNQHPSESAVNVKIYVDILCIANTFL